MASWIESLRCLLLSGIAILLLYLPLSLGLARSLFPTSSAGNLLQDPAGKAVGSRLIGQAFSAPWHFWPRPSAVGHDAAAAGGSNKSPTNPALRERALELIARHGADRARPLPLELIATSGSGLDPHLSLAAARYQAERVAGALQVPVNDVLDLVEELATRPASPLWDGRLVNVLELNLALQARFGTR